MLCAVVLCVAAAAGGQQVATDGWFTLAGDRLEPSKNLIEILPEPIGMDQRVLLDLRVSRDRERTSFGGRKYRSYYAKVVVDCPARRAWYLRLSYYAQPIWTGEVIAKEQYKEGEAEVLFKDMSSEWSQRMVTAACKVRKLSG